MRTNLPVTQHEFVIPDGVTLVSVTDLASRITYCNPAFIAVSGYSKEELLGQLKSPRISEPVRSRGWGTV